MPLPILHPVPVRSGLPLEKLLPALALRGAQPNPPLLRLASSLGSLGIAQGQGAWHAKGSPSPSDHFGALAAASSADGREARPGSAPTEHARLLSRASPAAGAAGGGGRGGAGGPRRGGREQGRRPASC